jgi:hypothetical protein
MHAILHALNLRTCSSGFLFAVHSDFTYSMMRNATASSKVVFLGFREGAADTLKVRRRHQHDCLLTGSIVDGYVVRYYSLSGAYV